MIRNYIKIAFRNLLKNKIYSVLNIVGLSIGIACTLLLFLFVQDELSYDTDYPFAERTYRVASKINMMGQTYDLAVAPAPLGKTFLSNFPEVQNFEYRSELNLGIILSSGLIVLIIAMLTVSYHAVKAASINPKTSIKYE